MMLAHHIKKVEPHPSKSQPSHSEKQDQDKSDTKSHGGKNKESKKNS